MLILGKKKNFSFLKKERICYIKDFCKDNKQGGILGANHAFVELHGNGASHKIFLKFIESS